MRIIILDISLLWVQIILCENTVMTHGTIFVWSPTQLNVILDINVKSASTLNDKHCKIASGRVSTKYLRVLNDVSFFTFPNSCNKVSKGADPLVTYVQGYRRRLFPVVWGIHDEKRLVLKGFKNWYFRLVVSLLTQNVLRNIQVNFARF